ncbi:triphosphoribosyl-dephospho-CoA synthase [Legionella sp. km772]|uniref:triphosphoribosyl-dephospho-CoA synthase n=1 Tax=Legionella sp. km772 TaxID=2498111 RepID=UPI0021007897|nr:triphosphoribosyl-dephospho-CoA synthase [Legionella sp. km772]
MDGALFLRSLFGLRHYFFQAGLQAALNASPHILVNWGKQAEQRMHRITGGINTHRGAIFALGIFCTSVCKLTMKYRAFSSRDLHQAIINDWSVFLEKHHRNENTHGALVKHKYAVADAKQIAIEGYQLVFELYHELRENVEDKVFFGLMAYQRLLLTIDDINILYRTGKQGLAFARQQIQAISFHDRQHALQQTIELHHLFSQKNISPGGVADMLSVLYFLHYLFSGK